MPAKPEGPCYVDKYRSNYRYLLLALDENIMLYNQRYYEI